MACHLFPTATNDEQISSNLYARQVSSFLEKRFYNEWSVEYKMCQTDYMSRIKNYTTRMNLLSASFTRENIVPYDMPTNGH